MPHSASTSTCSISPGSARRLVFTPRHHNPWQGCLAAGLPCVLFEGPGPRYGRFLLASDQPAELASQLKKALDDGNYRNYRIVEMSHHVRVEFATTNVRGKAIDDHLQVRVDDDPTDDYHGRRSAAREALLADDVAVGMYVNLGGALDGARYMEARQLAERLEEIDTSERMRAALTQTADLARLAHLDMAEQAEFEDVSVTARGSGDSYRIDVISTRTPFGKKLAAARSGEVTLPDLAVGDGGIEAEWNVQLHELDSKVDPKQWLASKDRQKYPSLGDLGEWAWLGAWRSPTTVSASIADRLRGAVGGSDLSRIVAGRIQVAPAGGDGAVKSWNNVRGGASLLLAADSKSNELVGALSGFENAVGPLETGVVKHSDGRYEVRFAFNAPLSKVFSKGSKSAVERFELRAAPEAARRLARSIRAAGGDRFAPVTSRILAGLTASGPLRISHSSDQTWSGLGIAVGSDASPSVDLEAPDFELHQPDEMCLAGAAKRSAAVMEEAVRADDIDSYLSEFFQTSRAQKYRNAIVECGGDDSGETDLSTWAASYLDAWRALTSYRVGDRKWGKKVLEVCEEGHEWACGFERGTWPWIRAKSIQNGDDASSSASNEKRP